MKELETILADAFAEARTLEGNRASFSVERVREILKDVEEATEEWTTWLSETDASIRSGYSEDTLRGKFELLKRDGHARLAGRNRQYRACALPRRANVVAASARGREAARAMGTLQKVG